MAERSLSHYLLQIILGETEAEELVVLILVLAQDLLGYKSKGR